jgi:hypothetical protein
LSTVLANGVPASAQDPRCIANCADQANFCAVNCAMKPPDEREACFAFCNTQRAECLAKCNQPTATVIDRLRFARQ